MANCRLRCGFCPSWPPFPFPLVSSRLLHNSIPFPKNPAPHPHDELLLSFPKGSAPSSPQSVRFAARPVGFPSRFGCNSIDPFPRVQALSKIACNRLQKELAEWQVSPPAGFKHKVSDNLQRCRFFRRVPSCNPSLVMSSFFAPCLFWDFSFVLFKTSS